MRTALAPSLAVAVLALSPGFAQARGAYQEGVVSYSVTGSWVTSFSGQDRCEVATAPGETELRSFRSTTTERGTFASGRGTAHYQGRVGSEPFFLGNGDRPARLAIKVTRTITRPVACTDLEREDCGTRTLRGVVSSEFDGARPLSLRVHFADRPGDYDVSDPFKTCAKGGGLFLSALNEARDTDYQDQALRYPTRASFWSRKRQRLAGTVTEKGVRFSMAMKTARRTLKSKRDLHP